MYYNGLGHTLRCLIYYNHLNPTLRCSLHVQLGERLTSDFSVNVQRALVNHFGGGLCKTRSTYEIVTWNFSLGNED